MNKGIAKDKITPELLDQYLAIASWVDSKITVKKPRLHSMYDYIAVIPDKMDHSKFKPGRIKVQPTSKQLDIYEFITSIMLKASSFNRDLLYLRNFPKRKSFRDMKYFFIGDSHETIRTNYNAALFDVCRMVNKIGIEKFI